MRRGRLHTAADRVREGTGFCSELSICAGREVLVQGVKAILDYSESEVRLRLCDMILCVRGDGLGMKSYYGGAVCVCGHITELCFER